MLYSDVLYMGSRIGLQRKMEGHHSNAWYFLFSFFGNALNPMHGTIQYKVTNLKPVFLFPTYTRVMGPSSYMMSLLIQHYSFFMAPLTVLFVIFPLHLFFFLLRLFSPSLLFNLLFNRLIYSLIIYTILVPKYWWIIITNSPV